MADNTQTPEPVPADQTVAPSQGPATATPQDSAPVAAAEPAVLSSPEQTPAAPEAAAAPAVAADEAPKAEEAPAKAEDTSGSLLSDATTKEPVNADEAPKAEEVKTDQPAVQLPTYEKYTLPEGVTLDDAKLGEFNTALGEFETLTKADHGEMQKFGQRLMDLYTKEAKEYVARVAENQVNVWNRLQDTWKDEFRKDPQLGGNRQQTTITNCAKVIEKFGAAQGADAEAALRAAFKMTGAGNHPAIIRFVNWAARFTVERARPVAANNPKPPVTNSRAQRRYGNTNGAA